MKYILIVFALCLSACVDRIDEKPQTINDGTKPAFTVLRATTNANDITDVSIFCIDSVKYLVIPGIGITVKYYNDGSSDPYPETCVNQTTTQLVKN